MMPSADILQNIHTTVNRILFLSGVSASGQGDLYGDLREVSSKYYDKLLRIVENSTINSLDPFMFAFKSTYAEKENWLKSVEEMCREESRTKFKSRIRVEKIPAYNTVDLSGGRSAASISCGGVYDPLTSCKYEFAHVESQPGPGQSWILPPLISYFNADIELMCRICRSMDDIKAFMDEYIKLR